MFDLAKDIDVYRGIPPYASEHYGVYQPLLGWQSNLTKRWLKKGGPLIDPLIKRILDGRIVPGPLRVQNQHPLEFLADPLQPGAGRSPFRVFITKDLNSELLKIIRDKVQAFVDAHDGKLPTAAEWNMIIDINNLMDVANGDLRKANDAVRTRLNQDMQRQAAGGAITDTMIEAARPTMLALMQYESQIATFLLAHAEAQPGFNPDDLKKLFSVQRSRSSICSVPAIRWRTSIRATTAARSRRSASCICSGSISSTSARFSANRSSTSGCRLARRSNWWRSARVVC
jgi:hypothetical protein